MINDSRRFWSTLIFIGLAAPFLIVFILTMVLPGNNRGGLRATTGPGEGVGAALALPAVRTEVPVVAAGDGRDLWVVVPPVPSATTGGAVERGFEIYHRASNNGIWSRSQRKWLGVPETLALMLPPAPVASAPASGAPRPHSTPYVVTRAGGVTRYSLDNAQTAASLPAGQIIKAAAGGADSLFVLTLGAAGRAAATGPATREAVTTVPTTNVAAPPVAVETAPATAASRTPTFNIYWFPPHGLEGQGLRPSEWSPLPALGEPSADASAVPAASSLVALAVHGSRLVVLWIDPIHPENLLARTLDYRAKDAAWSPAVTTPLPLADRGAARLFAVTLDQSLYALWTVRSDHSVFLHGGRLATGSAESVTPFTLPAGNHLAAPVELGPADEVSAATDFAIGPSENSFIAVTLNKERGAQSLAFDDLGRIIAPVAAIEPRSLQHDVQISQNILTVLLLVMFTLSLWQWRQKPVALELPTGMMIAPLHLRGIAFLIDMVVPYLITLTVYGLWEEAPFGPLANWVALLNKPQDLLRSQPPLVFVGIYVLHVSVGELFFRRSIGKAVVGLQVLMLDGKAPTLAAIVIRNLVRLPETIAGLVLLYILISERHQRLGDVLARTLVVSAQPPETPPDPDK